MKPITTNAAGILKICLLWMSVISLQVFAGQVPEVVTELRHQSWGVSADTLGHRDKVRGLPQVSARAIVRDPDGLLWIGTENGIARFDGIDFEVFHSRNTPELTSGWVDALFLDASQQIWVATSDGVLVYKNQMFRRVHRAQAGFRGIRFAQTEDGTLWLGGNKLWTLQDSSLRIVPFHHGGVADLVSIGDDLWVVDEAKQVVIYHERVATVLDASLWRDQDVRKLLVFRGVPHVVTGDSVYRLERSTGGWVSRELPIPTTARLITGVADEELVVLDSEGALHVLDTTRFIGGSAEAESSQTAWIQPSLPEPVPVDLSEVAMAVDSAHSIWVGLVTEGLHHYWASAVAHEGSGQPLAGAKVWSFFVDDTVHAVTDDGVYRRVAGANWVLDISASEVEGARPYSYWQSAESEYLGTRSGLFWRTRDGGPFSRMGVLGEKPINVLVPDGDRLFIGTGSGLFSHDLTSGDVVPVANTEEGGIRAVMRGGDGRLWVGTQSGLVVFDRSGSPLPLESPVQANLKLAFITGIEEFAPGWLAISTYGRGVFIRSPDDVWTQYGTQEGLPFEDFFGLLPERDWLWLSSASGLVRVAIDGLLKGELRADVLLRDDGVFMDRSRVRCCNGAGNRRIVAHDGKAFLPTLEGVLAVRLDTPVVPARAPLVKAVWKLNNRLPIAEHYELAEKERNIELAFTVPNFDSDNLPQFRYRLLPMHDDWLYSGERKVAFFTNLPSGRLTFELQSRIGASDWLSAPPVNFYVQPHLHETWYARLTLAVGAVLIVWLLLRYRTHHLLHRAMLLERAVAERTAEAEVASRAMMETARDSQRLVREANAPIFTLSADGTIIDWNRAAEKLTGWQSDDVVGTNIEALIPDVQPRLNVSALFARLECDGYVDGIKISFNNRRSRRISLLLGGTLLPAFQEVPERLVLVGQDLTDYLEREQELIQASKMSTLGEMATGMAHELNQPLNAINLTANNLARKLKKNPQDISGLPDKLNRISEQVDRARKIIDHLRLYGRRSGTPGGEVKTLFDPLIPIADALSMFREQLVLDSVELREDLGAAGAQVLGDPLLLEQVLMNLIGNARDAIREHYRDGDKAFIDVRTKLVGQLLVIEVEDSGGGASEDTLLNMFQPFYTTKPPGKGTGLGLSISYGVVRNMSGSISARIGDRGLIVSIELPVKSFERDV